MRIAKNLDMLRAIAVLYVALDHSLKFFGVATIFGVDLEWLGKLGVMFFFVHTCAVLMMSLERSEGQLGRLKDVVGSFYLRRIFRIYPLSIFAICAVLFFAIPQAKIDAPFHIARMIPTHTDLFLNLALLQNFHHNSIIAVLWSLPFEMQMYVFLPFLFVFLAKKGNLAWLWAIWIGGWALEFAMRPHLMFISHFVPGVMAYVCLNRIQKGVVSAWLWPVFLGCLTVAFLAFHPSFFTGAPVCLALGMASPYFRSVTSKPINFLTHNIAKYSYGIYLAHMFCLWFAFLLFPSLPMVVKAVLFPILLIGVPVALYHLLEDPMIKVGAKLAVRVFGEGPKKVAPAEVDATGKELKATAGL